MPSTFSAVRDMHEAMVTEQSTANEALNTVAGLLNVLVVGAAEAEKSQQEAEGRQLAWNEKFKNIYIATLVVAIIAAVAAVVSIVVAVNATATTPVRRRQLAPASIRTRSHGDGRDRRTERSSGATQTRATRTRSERRAGREMMWVCADRSIHCLQWCWCLRLVQSPGWSDPRTG